MVEIRYVILTKSFKHSIKKMKDASLKERIKKQVEKAANIPESGKELRYGLKGMRTLYVKPFRIIYKIEGDRLILLKFEHRESAYG
jgi:mRNA-degrading endonuclease RelE of RelBE toxin-antitoxin system